MQESEERTVAVPDPDPEKIHVEIEVESDDEGLEGVGRRRSMYEETAHDTWPLSFRVPRRVAIALRAEYERRKEADEFEKYGPHIRNFSTWLQMHFRSIWPGMPWEEPVAVVDDEPEGK